MNTKTITISKQVTVGELAELLGVQVTELITTLFMIGKPQTINQYVAMERIPEIAKAMKREIVVLEQAAS
jgi:hypothetical protein